MINNKKKQSVKTKKNKKIREYLVDLFVILNNNNFILKSNNKYVLANFIQTSKINDW